MITKCLTCNFEFSDTENTPQYHKNLFCFLCRNKPFPPIGYNTPAYEAQNFQNLLLYCTNEICARLDAIQADVGNIEFRVESMS